MGHSDALRDCLHLDHEARIDHLTVIDTPTLSRWAAERGRPRSWCEGLRQCILAVLMTRHAAPEAES